MKTRTIYALLLILTGCGKNDDTVAPQVPVGCIVTGYDYTRTGGPASSSGTIGYEFDPAGNLLRATDTYTTNANTVQSTSSYYRYDASGFVQESTTQSLSEYVYAGNKYTSTSTETDRFTYANNLLATAVRRSVTSNISYTGRSQTTETYQYDAGGKLAQYTSVDSASRSTTVYYYANGLLNRVTDGGKERYVFENGRVVGTPGGQKYTYDANGRLSKRTSLPVSGTSSVTEYTYEEGGQPLFQAFPQFQFKGMPFAALFQTFVDAERYGLLRKSTTYRETNGSRQPDQETVYTNQLNAQGYPTRQTAVFTKTGETTQTSTVRCTYRNCP